MRIGDFERRINLLFVCRIFIILYYGITTLLLVGAHHPVVVISLYIFSSSLTIIILERELYDIRSSIVLLLICCTLYFAGRPTFADGHFGWYFIFAQAVYILFLTGLLIGLCIGWAKQNYDNNLISTANKNRFIYITILAMIIYFALHRYILHAVGAQGNFVELVFTSILTRSAMTEKGLSPLLQFSYICMIFGLASAFVLWRNFKLRVFVSIWLLLIGYVALTLGSRGNLVIPIIQLLLATSLMIPNPRRLILMIIPLVFAISVFSIWFSSAREGISEVNTEYSLLDRFDAYDNWLTSISKNGILIDPGVSLRDAPLQFFPRQFFEDKPYYFSTQMTRLYHQDAFDRGVNLDYGGIAESIYNFGMFGPLCFGIFIGWVATRLEKIRHHALHTHSAMSAFIYSQGALLPASFFFVGWINTSLLFTVVGFILCAWILKFLESRTINIGCLK